MSVTGGVRVLTLNLWGCRGRGTSAGPSWPTVCAGSDPTSSRSRRRSWATATIRSPTCSVRGTTSPIKP